MHGDQCQLTSRWLRGMCGGISMCTLWTVVVKPIVGKLWGGRASLTVCVALLECSCVGRDGSDLLWSAKYIKEDLKHMNK